MRFLLQRADMRTSHIAPFHAALFPNKCPETAAQVDIADPSNGTTSSAQTPHQAATHSPASCKAEVGAEATPAGARLLSVASGPKTEKWGAGADGRRKKCSMFKVGVSCAAEKLDRSLLCTCLPWGRGFDSATMSGPGETKAPFHTRTTGSSAKSPLRVHFLRPLPPKASAPLVRLW